MLVAAMKGCHDWSAPFFPKRCQSVALRVGEEHELSAAADELQRLLHGVVGGNGDEVTRILEHFRL
jgi:hypothetical protein